MNVDMEMDVAWCLTCSKQTRDPRSPYCSEECRVQDTHPSAVQHDISVPLTSPVPFGLVLASPKLPAHSGHPTPRANNPPMRRPSVTPLAPLPSSSSSRSRPVPRDRRAFSFPATHSVAPVAIKSLNSRRPTQTVETLQFARKANAISFNAMTSSPAAGSLPQRKTKGFAKLSQTTGANTPVFQDAVFCSTSESSDNEALDTHDVSPMKMPPAVDAAQGAIKPLPKHRASMSQAFMTPSTSHSSGRPVALQPARLPPLVSRKSPSPVAAMIASSASSKSRDDIVSWLNEVKRLPTRHHHDDEDEDTHRHLDETYRSRGRSRTRRDVLANLPPPSQEPLDDHDGDNGVYGTTPKGRIGSALAGLSSFGSFGVRPIVKALTSVTSPGTSIQAPPMNPPAGATTGLGLQSVPAPAEISRVEVMVGPPSEPDTSNMLFMGGATPTLSTISFSEVVDPMTDNGDHTDFMTTADDQSAAGSSSFVKRLAPSGSRRASAILAASVGKKQSPSKDGTQRPLQPLQTTASAIWNLSSYLRSFAPFSISSVIPPYAPIAAAAESRPADSTTATAAPSPTKAFEEIHPAPAPVPAARMEVAEEVPESPAQQMVRSLPMDIILPVGGENPQLERLRRHEMREWLETPVSADTSRSQSRARSRSRHRSHARRRSKSGHHSRSASHSLSRHGRKVSYDADASEEEESTREGRRGRSRREKILRKSSDEEEREVEVASPIAVEEERGRGRGRERDRTIRV
ncbi:hypothetical protein IAU59_000914 [Kwoniella sp. CBS 9459]